MASDQPQTPHESLWLGYAAWRTEADALVYTPVFDPNSKDGVLNIVIGT